MLPVHKNSSSRRDFFCELTVQHLTHPISIRFRSHNYNGTMGKPL